MTNPYKHVRGGDPAMRPAKIEYSYECPECAQGSTRLIDDGQQAHTMLKRCQKCEDALNIIRQSIADEKTRVRILGKEPRPLRSWNEFEALLEQYEDFPQKPCQGSCHGTYLIADMRFPFLADDVWRENSINTVSFVSDPFEAEIHDRHEKMWLCKVCYSLSEQEI